MLVNPSGSLLFRYFDLYRKRGGDAAFSWALEQMVGPEGYAALLSSDAVPGAGFRQVADVVLGILLGNPRTLPKSPKTT